MIKNYITFCLFMCSAMVQAQEVIATDSIKKKRVSNEHIELYDDYIKLRLGFSNSFNSFHIKDEADNLDFTLTPNQRLKTTLTFMYKFIEFYIGYRFKGPDKINKILNNPPKPKAKKKTAK